MKLICYKCETYEYILLWPELAVEHI